MFGLYYSCIFHIWWIAKLQAQISDNVDWRTVWQQRRGALYLGTAGYTESAGSIFNHHHSHEANSCIIAIKLDLDRLYWREELINQFKAFRIFFICYQKHCNKIKYFINKTDQKQQMAVLARCLQCCILNTEIMDTIYHWAWLLSPSSPAVSCCPGNILQWASTLCWMLWPLMLCMSSLAPLLHPWHGLTDQAVFCEPWPSSSIANKANNSYLFNYLALWLLWQNLVLTDEESKNLKIIDLSSDNGPSQTGCRRPTTRYICIIFPSSILPTEELFMHNAVFLLDYARRLLCLLFSISFFTFLFFVLSNVWKDTYLQVLIAPSKLSMKTH